MVTKKQLAGLAVVLLLAFGGHSAGVPGDIVVTINTPVNNSHTNDNTPALNASASSVNTTTMKYSLDVGTNETSGCGATSCIVDLSKNWVIGAGGDSWSGNVTISEEDEFDSHLTTTIDAGSDMTLNYANIIVNGGFELGGVVPYNWSVGFSSDTHHWDQPGDHANGVYDGNRCERSNLIGGGTNRYDTAVYSCSGNTVYILEWAQISDVAYSNRPWNVVTDNGTIHVITSEHFVWTTYSETVTTPIGASTFYLSLYHHENGNTSVDNVKVYLNGSAPYYTTGNITAVVKDAEAVEGICSVWKQIKIDGAAPTDTNVSIYVNTSSDNGASDAYSGWQLVGSNVTIGTFYEIPSSYQERYGSWRLVFQTSNASATPEISSVTFGAALIDGRRNVTVYANDTVGNENATISYFTVDTVAPTITWNTPADNNATSVAGILTHNITFNDANLYMLNCTIYNDSAMTNVMWTYEIDLTGNSTWTLTEATDVSGWGGGTYYEDCTITDVG